MIIILIAGGYYWYNNSKSGTAAVQYKTTVVEKGMLTTSISGSGNIIVDQLATVDPTITGTVTNLTVKIGDAVKKGQILFIIENDQIDVNLARSKASYKLAQKDKDDSKQDRLNYETAKLDYENQKATADKRTVVAPIDGTVNVVNIKNGDDLSRVSGSGSNAQAPITIGDFNTLKAYISVNEVDIADVSIGQKATLTFSAIDELSATGKVEKIDSLGTLASGVVSYNVIIGFDALDPRIKPEMSVSADIITAVKPDVLLVPNSAVKTQNGNSYVQVLNGQMPESKTVEIGLFNDLQTEILSGLKIGENVVTQTIDPNTSATTTSQSGGLSLPGMSGGGASRAFHAN